MAGGIDLLSEREQDVLRLLLAGHTAKSAASELDLSVHTVNDYLREARKKLGVGSSKEAARLLSEHEATPQNLGREEIGIGSAASSEHNDATDPAPASRPLNKAWVIGGIAMLATIAAAIIFMSANHPVTTSNAEVTMTEPAKMAEESARDWIALIDKREFEASWEQAGTSFQENVTAENWTEMVKQVRSPLGAVSTRTIKAVTAQKDPPNAPKGDYQIVQYDTKYTDSAYVLETAVMMDEGGKWKVVGYFIR